MLVQPGVVLTEHAVQLPQQTTFKVVFDVRLSVRFVFAPVVIVQEEPGVRFS